MLEKLAKRVKAGTLKVAAAHCAASAPLLTATSAALWLAASAPCLPPACRPPPLPAASPRGPPSPLAARRRHHRDHRRGPNLAAALPSPASENSRNLPRRHGRPGARRPDLLRRRHGALERRLAHTPPHRPRHSPRRLPSPTTRPSTPPSPHPPPATLAPLTRSRPPSSSTGSSPSSTRSTSSRRTSPHLAAPRRTSPHLAAPGSPSPLPRAAAATGQAAAPRRPHTLSL